jgi:predicted anti-sigma-YlaC factor YlaD
VTRKPYSIKLSCREASHLVSEGLDRRLGWIERIALRVHLAICEGCTNFSKQVGFLRKAVRQLGSRRS